MGTLLQTIRICGKGFFGLLPWSSTMLDHSWKPLCKLRLSFETLILLYDDNTNKTDCKRIQCPLDVTILCLTFREAWLLSYSLYFLPQVCCEPFLWNRSWFLWNLTAGTKQSILKHLCRIWYPNFSFASPSLVLKCCWFSQPLQWIFHEISWIL